MELRLSITKEVSRRQLDVSYFCWERTVSCSSREQGHSQAMIRVFARALGSTFCKALGLSGFHLRMRALRNPEWGNSHSCWLKPKLEQVNSEYSQALWQYWQVPRGSWLSSPSLKGGNIWLFTSLWRLHPCWIYYHPECFHRCIYPIGIQRLKVTRQ